MTEKMVHTVQFKDINVIMAAKMKDSRHDWMVSLRP